MTLRFDLNSPTVHNLYVWSYAYKMARRGPWEQVARDQFRFKQRIEKTGEIIEPVLKKFLSRCVTAQN